MSTASKEPDLAVTARTRFFQDASTGESKRFRTRALILDTAIALIAERGIERASIVEIAERAGLSNGSFYYHFRDKAELLDAVGAAIATTLAVEVDSAIEDLVNGTERVATASLLVIRTAMAAPTWGGLIVHALGEIGEFRDQISAGIQKDVRIGVDQGLFDILISPALFALLLSIVATAIRALLIDPVANAGADTLAVQLILRSLGVPPADADAFVHRANEALARHDLRFDPGASARA